jgi:Ca2+/Na+ antiporter
MSSKGRDEIYTCVGILLFVLAIVLYVVWFYYGFLPFVIGALFVIIFVVFAVYSSRKAKKNKASATGRLAFSTFQNVTPEQREKLLELEGFTKYTDENGNTRWRVPKDGPEWAKAEKIDVVLKDGSLEIEMEKQSPKIRCSYCGTVYDERLDKCPNCGASRQGNEEQVKDTTP